MSFGANLIRFRESKGISRKELAEMLDIPYTTLRNYETEQREPGHKFLIKAANLLSITVDELIGNVSVKEKNAPSQKDEALLTSFHQLNEEGQEKVVDYADDLVQTGKYIKNNSPELGKKA